MASRTVAHSRIQRSLAIAIGGRRRCKPCRFYGSVLKIDIACTYRYLAGEVVRSPTPRNATTIPDLFVIFEVLSDSTALTDLITKNQEYAAVPSVCHYIVLSQDEMADTMFERIGVDWVGHLLRADSILRLPEIDIEVPLAELYDGIDFSSDGSNSPALA